MGTSRASRNVIYSKMGKANLVSAPVKGYSVRKRVSKKSK